MKKKYVLIIVIAVLVVAVAALAIANRATTLALDAEETEAVITIDGEKVAEFDLEWLKTLEKVTFDDHIKENGEPKRDVSFTGVELKTVIDAIGVDISQCSAVAFRGRDSYMSASSIEEMYKNGKVYIVYERNGLQTLGKSMGGTGPMEIVITNEVFSMRNCKFLIEIAFES